MEAFHEFAREYAAYGYPVLFLGVLLENAGIPVPGETAVLMAGFLASAQGGGHFKLYLVVFFTFLAAVIGDNVGFWLGHRWARPRLQTGRGFLFLTPRTLQLAEGYFQRYGEWTVFFARFIAGLRVVGALAAGTAGMHWRKFLFANAAGALAWATTMSLLGYFFGQSLELLHKWMGRGGLILLGCVIVLVGFPFLLRRLRGLPQARPGVCAVAAEATTAPSAGLKPLWQRMVGTQIGLGLLAAVLEVVCISLLVLAAEPRAEVPPPGALHLSQRIEAWLGKPPEQSVAAGIVLFGNYAATLPAVLFVCAILALELRYRRRSIREIGALVGVLLLSEVTGLVLVGLLRRRGIVPVSAFAWPGGFAGLAPLRAVAVYGMAAYLVGLQRRSHGYRAKFCAGAIVLAVGLATIWSGEQRFTEVMLEYAAGAVALFAGIWWLEGFPGLLRPAGHSAVDSGSSGGNGSRPSTVVSQASSGD
jgi:membrane protein DedA with SNARE-associated domain